MFGYLGSRGSSIDETRRHDGSEDVTKEDETVVDPEQGNSTSPFQLGQLPAYALANTMIPSALPYYIPATTWRRSEQSHVAHLHPRTAVDAGAHNKVCSGCNPQFRRHMLTDSVASWHTPKPFFLFQRSRTLCSDL